MLKLIQRIIRRTMIAVVSHLPLLNIIILESLPDLGDNAGVLFDFFLENDVAKKYKIYWFLNQSKTGNEKKIKNVDYIERHSASFLESLKLHYVLYRAKFIFDSNNFVYMQRKNQVRIHLGHGMPIKAPRKYCSEAREMSHILVTSNAFKPIYNDLFKVPEDCILNIGMPRNDDLFKKNQSLKETLFGNKKVVVWMPTYRQHKNGDLDVASNVHYGYGLPCLSSEKQVNELRDFVKKHQCVLVFRIHPAQNIDFLNLQEDEWLINGNDAFLNQNHLKLYELLALSDAMITDYSSVYYDYLLTNQPIGLTIDDLEDYSQTFELAFDYKENIKGDYLLDFNDVKQFIENVAIGNDELYPLRQEAKERFHDVTDGTSCEALLQYLKEYYQF